jgi:hypothetical protein
MVIGMLQLLPANEYARAGLTYRALFTMGTLAASTESDAPVIEGVVNAASYSSPVAAGSIVSIFGSNLRLQRRIPSAISLGGTSASFNGIPAPYFSDRPAR